MPAVLLDSQKIILESGGFGSILVFEFRTIGYINATYLVGNNYYTATREWIPQLTITSQSSFSNYVGRCTSNDLELLLKGIWIERK